MEILEILKLIVEKLNVLDLVISVLFSALGAKFITDDKIWLIIIFCTTFILMQFIRWISQNITIQQKNYNEKKCKTEEVNKSEQSHKEMIWRHFISLSDKDLKYAQDIYNAKQPDPKDSYLRLIPDRSEVAGLFHYSNDNPFDINVGYRTYYPCIRAEFKRENIMLIFDPYFYDLLEHYLLTGRKERI